MAAIIPYGKAEAALGKLVATLRAAGTSKQVLSIRIDVEGIRAAARAAKDRRLFADATLAGAETYRVLGRIMERQKETVGLAKGGKPHQRRFTGVNKTPVEATLTDAGIDKNIAKRARAAWRRTDAEWNDYLKYLRESLLREADRAGGRFWRHQKHIEQRAANVMGDGCTVADLGELAATGYRANVIYADPPWTFEVYSGEGKDRSAERYYDTMDLASIGALPVAPLCGEDCALLMWCVSPELSGALDVTKAWGFEYKTVAFVWVKQNRSGNGLFTGMGYWTRANAELCLLATRGSPKRIATDVHQIISAPVAEHSAKPEEARRRIERLLGEPRGVDGPADATSHLELFARARAPGWTAWGNEIPRSDLIGQAAE